MKRRITVIAMLSALVVFAIGSAVAWTVVRSNRFADADAALKSRLTVFMDNLVTDPTVDSLETAAAFTSGSDQLAWSYSLATDTLYTASFLPDDASQDRIVSLLKTGDGSPTNVYVVLTDDGESVAAVPTARSWRIAFAETENSSEFVIMGSDQTALRASIRRLALLFAAASVLAALVVGIVVRISVARALRPVERIRAEAEQITSQNLDRRVPVPAQKDEIHRLATTTNELLDRVERAHQRQRSFISDASHELRNPMAALVVQLETGLPQLQNPDDREMATSALGSVRRLQRLVNDLLVLANNDEGNIPLRLRLVDLDEVATDVATAMRATTNVHIDLRSISAAAAVVDQDRISQLLTNLIANAIRACRSAVSVGVAEQGPNATIWIDDDGPGIALEDRERIFQRFVRLDAARDQESGGSGLGLAICRDIVAAHNGSIAVEESPIGGARFVVRLPLRKG